MIASADSMTSHTCFASKFLSINQHNWCRDTLVDTVPDWLQDPAAGGKAGGTAKIEENRKDSITGDRWCRSDENRKTLNVNGKAQ